MKMHNITGFIKWHIRKFKLGVGHVFIISMVYLWINIIFVDVKSPWYFINLLIGLVPLVIVWFYVWLWYPIRESYKNYQKEKRDLLNTIDTGEKYK